MFTTVSSYVSRSINVSQNKRSLDHGQDTGWSGDNTGFGVTQTSVRILLLLVQFGQMIDPLQPLVSRQ